MAITITWPDVVLIAPELSAATNQVQAMILADVNELLSLKQWGNQKRLDMAAKYYAAHLGTLVGPGPNGPAGAVTSEGAGPINRAYAAPLMTDEFLSSTIYGRRLINLRKAVIMPFFVC